MKYEYTETTLKIAKYMGITPIKGINEKTGNEYYYYNNYELKDYEALPFYNTWEDLMPVVNKIISERFDDWENVYLRIFGIINQENNKIMVRFNRCQLFEADTLLEATYMAVCDYVSAVEKN